MGSKPRPSGRARRQKGLRLQRIAQEILERMGVRVEVARNLIRWIPDGKGGRKPISASHDFFGVWDLLCLWPDGARSFVQVTVLEEVAHHRQKILAAQPPCLWGNADVLLGWKGGGRDRHFRVYRGPGFEEWTGECWRPVIPLLEEDMGGVTP